MSRALELKRGRPVWDALSLQPVRCGYAPRPVLPDAVLRQVDALEKAPMSGLRKMTPAPTTTASTMTAMMAVLGQRLALFVWNLAVNLVALLCRAPQGADS